MKARKFEIRLKSILFILLLGWLFAQGALSLYNYLKMYSLRKKLEKDALLLRARIAVLEREKEFLSSPEGIKTIARLRLGMKEDGERIIYTVVKGEEE